MNENEAVLNQKFFFAEYIDREPDNPKQPEYIKIKYRKIEQYSFYLRFLGKWYIPCEKDQATLKDYFLNAELNISQQTATINFNQNITKNKIHYTFNMRFIGNLITWQFKPCPKCQQTLRQLMLEADSITIGNEKYEHPIEFNRRIVDDDKTFFTVEKHHPPTANEIKAIGDRWIYEEISQEIYDKTPIIAESK